MLGRTTRSLGDSASLVGRIKANLSKYLRWVGCNFFALKGHVNIHKHTIRWNQNFPSVQVVKDSLTQKAGLLPNDFLISVAGGEVYEMTHDQVSFQQNLEDKHRTNGE